MKNEMTTVTYQSLLIAVENGNLLSEEDTQAVVEVLENSGGALTNNGKKRLMYCVKMANLLYHNGHSIVDDSTFDMAYNVFLQLGYNELVGAPNINFKNGGMPEVEALDGNVVKMAKEKEANNSKVKHDENIKKVFNTTSKAYAIHTDDNEKSVEKFINSVPAETFSVILSEKFDGISIGATNDETTGLITRGRTRGNAEDSLDVTDILSKHAIMYIDGTPCTLSSPIKYEMIMTKDNFKTYQERKGKTLKTRRGAIAGFVKDKNAIDNIDCITLVPLDILIDGLPRKERLDVINTIVDAPTFHTISGTKKEILEQIEKVSGEIEAKRDSLDYDIDGVVIEVLDDELRKQMGSKENEWKNNYEIALKFEAKAATTILREVYFTVGKGGQVTPMGVFDKVTISNVDYEEATLSSANTLKRLKLRIGDEIIIKRQGDVIPHITKLPDFTEGTGKLVEYPKQCPSCYHVLDTSGEVEVKCVNDSCPSRVVAKAVNFLKVLKCDGISDESVDAIYNEVGFDNLAEFMDRLKDNDSMLKIVKEDKSKKIAEWYEHITSNPVKLADFLVALSLPSVGTVTADKMVELEFKYYDIGYNSELEELGPKTRRNILDALTGRITEIKKLLEIINIDDTYVAPELIDFKYVICTTGFTVTDEVRAKFNDIKYDNKVNKKTDLLVFKKDTSAKYKSAMALGVPVIEYSEYMKLDDAGLAKLLDTDKA